MKQTKNKLVKKKKALSTIVSTMVIILLSIVAITMVWVFVKNMIDDRIKENQSCFDVESSEKVTLNGYYTCFTHSDTLPDEVQFSISRGDIEIEAIVVSIMTGGSAESFTISNEIPDVPTNDLKPYGSNNWADPEVLPEKNAGLTYVKRVGQEISKVDWIRIAPIINGEQCGMTDQIYDVPDCSLLVP
jgi:hypothetical protein